MNFRSFKDLLRFPESQRALRVKTLGDLRGFAKGMRDRVPSVLPTDTKSVSTYTGTDVYGNHFRAPRVAHPRFSGRRNSSGLKYTPTPNPNIKPNEYMSLPFFEPISEKGWQPSKNVLSNMERMGNWGYMKPIDIANARAGDSNYAQKSYQAMMDYLQDPKNGWTIHKALTAENGGHLTWTHPTLPNIVVPNALWGSMNSSVPVVLTKGHNSESRTFLAGLDEYNSHNLTPDDARVRNLPSMFVKSKHPDLDYKRNLSSVAEDAENYNNSKDYRYFFNMEGNTNDFVMNAHRLNATIPEDTLKRYSNADTLSHELMHPAYDNFIYMGGFPEHPTNQMGKFFYSADPDHIPVFLSQYKEQLHHNTKGKRLMTPSTFDDDVQYGLDNIKDFGPESRRFLHSIQQLRYMASDPSLSDELRSAAQYALDQYKNMTPFIFGIGAVPATAFMQNNDDGDIRNIRNIHNGQR